MNIYVKRVSSPELWRECASATTGHDCKMSWGKMLAMGHSPIRASIWFIRLEDIPLFVASQLVRSHVGVQFFQRSKRTDRGSVDFRIECHDFGQRLDGIAELINDGVSEEDAESVVEVLDDMETEVKEWPAKFDRHAPTDLAFIINAEALINMAHKRLCSKASKETRDIVRKICELIEEQDPDLYQHLVPQCIYRGGICPEQKCCGYNTTETFKKALGQYRLLFVN